MRKTFSIAVHGGCGNIIKGRFEAAEEEAYLEELRESLQVGTHCLAQGKHGIDAICEAIRILEDSPLFNAGRGSVYTHSGTHEMDASLMEGRYREAGSVAGISRVRNPIDTARAVMEGSPHVMLSGSGAEEFAQEQGITLTSPSWFHDATRWEQYLKALREDRSFMDHDADDRKHGTVGAVALDRHGNLVAGTSTGGITNKKHGRIGDSPIIGAGTFADNRTCAVSCTGEGEYFLRSLTAHRISDLMELGTMSLFDASREAIRTLSELGGEGGNIAVDRNGNISMPFSTKGMFRGSASDEQGPDVRIYGETTSE
jgi:beta-aspartyl-peptidase (threonine type)